MCIFLCKSSHFDTPYWRGSKLRFCGSQIRARNSTTPFRDPYGVFRLLVAKTVISSRRFADFCIANHHLVSPATRAPSKKCVFPEGFARFWLHTLHNRFLINLRDHVFITPVRSVLDDVRKMRKMLVGVVENEHPLSCMLAMSWFFSEAPIAFPAPSTIQLLRAQIRKSWKTSIGLPFLMMTIPSYHAIFMEIFISPSQNHNF